MVGSSKTAIYAALFGNLGITITKFVAAAMTGNAAMWAESYHSASDTANQLLLLFGIKQSQKKYTYTHQFGHSMEQFFWSFIVATLIFGISGILSLEHGISALLSEEHHLEDPTINYVVLGIAVIFEGNALRIALKQFKKSIESQGEKFGLRSLFNEFKESKDPTLLTVIVEDSAALLGIGVAAIGIFLTHLTGNIVYDAVSSLIIGIILMTFAFFLAKENKGLLIGESISKKDYKTIVKEIRAINEVNKIITMKTMHLGPSDILIGIQVNLIDNLDTDQVEIVTDKIETSIMKILPDLNRQHIFVEIER